MTCHLAVELDHIFVCVGRSAPEAGDLIRFGLREGSSNTHAGQGTACRRFFFRNTMLELLWVEDEVEARSERSAPAKLWERWSRRQSGACPFGIVLRPGSTEYAGAPFPAVDYRPEWLPPGDQIYVAQADLEEPMWVFFPFLEAAHHERRFLPHPCGLREITRLSLASPLPLQSAAAKTALDRRIFTPASGTEYLATIEFDGGLRQQSRDFRPLLPLILEF